MAFLTALVRRLATVAAVVARARAKAAGVATRTLYNWLEQPTFSRGFRRARRQAFGQAISLTQRYAPMFPLSGRTTALGRESIELDDLAARVDDLEEAASDGASFGMAG